MQLQMIAISSENKAIYEKLVSELSKYKQKGKPKFFYDLESSTYKYLTLVVGTPGEARLLKQKLYEMKKQLNEEYGINARYC